MNKKLFEEYDDDVMTYDGDEMEDWGWDDYDDEYSGKDSHEELEDHLADCFPTIDYEYQDDECGDYAPTFDDGTVLGGDFEDDETDSDFAMSDDTDLDDWIREQ